MPSLKNIFKECGMKNSKKIVVLLTVLLSLFPLFSGGAKEATPVVESQYSIVDSRGVTVTLTEAPKRIVSLSPNITEILFTLGLGDKVVGRTEYCDYPPEAAIVPTVGDLFSPSIEMILALEPDIVVLGNLGQSQTIDALERGGLKVAFIDEQESIEGTYHLIDEVATLTGTLEQAKVINQAMRDNITKAQSLTFDSPTVYYVAGFGEWGDFTATGDTYLHDIITQAGGLNIAADATNWGYQVELILAHDPDIIILPAMWGSTPEETLTFFSTSPPYNRLTAVKEGKVITSVENTIMERQGPRSGLAILQLAEAFAELAK
jgi:iron complex transport system substrate-binding protein